MKEIIKKNLKIIIPALITLLITSITIAYFITQNKNIEEADIELEQQEIKDEIKEEIKKIKIDIKGEVKKPGVYELKENDRVSDQTTPNMIQRISEIFARNPLISSGL